MIFFVSVGALMDISVLPYVHSTRSSTNYRFHIRRIPYSSHSKPCHKQTSLVTSLRFLHSVYLLQVVNLHQSWLRVVPMLVVLAYIILIANDWNNDNNYHVYNAIYAIKFGWKFANTISEYFENRKEV